MPHLSPITWIFLYTMLWTTMIITSTNKESTNPSIN